MTTTREQPVRPARRPLPDAARGTLIGCAEVVPGISGGTVALITGVYETLIESAGHVVTAARRAVTGPRSAVVPELRRARWSVVVPVLAGMVLAVVVASSLLEPVVTGHPVGSRAVFFGLVLVSLVVPARMVGTWSVPLAALAVAMAVVAFLLTGLPAASAQEPSLLVVGLVAAVAVCALVVPGVSGSFLLLALGLYETTLGAVADRDLAYLAVFAAGATVGLASFVRVLQHLLTAHRAVTLAVGTGLMAGSLRALWPWQTEDRTLQAPGDDLWTTALLAVTGGAAVAVAIHLQRRSERGEAAAGAGRPPV